MQINDQTSISSSAHKKSGTGNFKNTYLNHKFERTSCVGIAADNSDNVHIADAHIQKRAATYLAHRTSAQFLCLHNMCAECIHHIASAKQKCTHFNFFPNPKNKAAIPRQKMDGFNFQRDWS
jgi:uncharacterized protein YlaI